MAAYRNAKALGVVAAVVVSVAVGTLWAQQPAKVPTTGPQEVRELRQQIVQLSKQDTLSQLFRVISKAVKPAVVEVRVTKKVEMQPLPPEFEEFFRQFGGGPGQRMAPRQQQDDDDNRPRRQPRRNFYSQGLGSGVIVDAKNGYVLTNYHVVGNVDKVEVVLPDGRTVLTEWVHGDPQTDLAVLKINADNLIDAPLGDSDTAEVGDWVLAIGSPESLQQTVTSGIVSAKGRWRRELRATHAYQDFIQTDAAINHGNSGGPLVNMRGEVIGINTAIVSRTGVNEGIGLAIPSNMVKSVMGQLIEKGEVTRGYLGVRFQELTARLAQSYKVPSGKGALVVDAVEDGPAAKAGLKSGDVITAVGDRQLQDGNDLSNIVAALTPGQNVQFEYYRDGEKHSAAVTIEKKPENITARMRPGAAPEAVPGKGIKVGLFGLRVATLDERLAEELGYKDGVKGVVITDVDPDSDAADQGVTEGMVITEVDGQPVSNAQQFAQAMQGKTDAARLRVLDPSGASQFVVVMPAKE